MSSDNHQGEGEGEGGYQRPSTAAELFAGFIGLALVYGMIALVGNASDTGPARATPVEQEKAPAGRTGKADMKQEVQVANVEPQAEAQVERAAVKHAPLPPMKGALKDYARGKLAAFFIHKSPRPLPDFSYVDEQGKSHSLKDLRGKVVLLNLWATWCGPCRHEMPWLDSLKDRYRDQPFEMLTISIDRGGLKKPRRFFDRIGIRHLTLYGDPTGRLASKLKAFGMPTTLLIDRKGRELGRMAGPAEWNSSDAHALINAAISSTQQATK